MKLRCTLTGLVIVGFLLFHIRSTEAQDVTVRAGFFKDSLRVGDQTGFFLAAEYPSDLNILFPDSTYSFVPFEYERRKYFPTETSDGKSYDSVVYYLSTFEIDRIQSLNLPVYRLNAMDCTSYYSPRDSILLTSLVQNVPDTIPAQDLPLKVNVAYQNVLYLFNYPIFVLVTVVVLVLVITGWLFFGKRILKHFRIKRMQKAHQKFLDAYNTSLESIKHTFSSITTESALSHWKKYMEQLESRPYTKLTTRETLLLEKDEQLGRNLHAVDGAIYGHNTSVMEPLEQLKKTADQRFTQKLEEVRHG